MAPDRRSSRSARLVLLVIYMPLAVVLITRSTSSRTFAWPPPGYTLSWWRRRPRRGARDALLVSVEVGAVATASRSCSARWPRSRCGATRFFGRNIRVPADHPADRAARHRDRHRAQQRVPDDAGLELGFLTIVIAHATFCIVTVFNNVQARLRRLGGNLEEASATSAPARSRRSRRVTFPMLRSALLAGGLLAFGLSFDEIVVTTFTAGPRSRPCRCGSSRTCSGPTGAGRQRRRGRAGAASAIPIYFAQRLSGDTVNATAAP